MADAAALPSPTSAPRQAARSQRLWEAMHPVCSHDLPSQVVALQSLLQLFEWDEAEHFTEQGREYYRRLQSIAGKTFAQVQFLKEIVRLQRYVPERVQLAFANLYEGIRAETQQLFPESAWQWEVDWPVECFRADRRLVQLGVVRLLRATCGAGHTSWLIRMQTAAHADHVEWSIGAHAQGPWTPTLAEAVLLEQRLARALAQEYLAATDIACHPNEGAASAATAFSLVIPHRLPHG